MTFDDTLDASDVVSSEEWAEFEAWRAAKQVQVCLTAEQLQAMTTEEVLSALGRRTRGATLALESESDSADLGA